MCALDVDAQELFLAGPERMGIYVCRPKDMGRVLLLARKRSSERTAMALIMRIMTIWA